MTDNFLFFDFISNSRYISVNDMFNQLKITYESTKNFLVNLFCLLFKLL